MEWKSVQRSLPESTGAYIVSVNQEGSNGSLVFEYVAWFYAPGKKWIRYDPFTDSQLKTLQGDITPLVVGWMDNVPVFLG